MSDLERRFIGEHWEHRLDRWAGRLRAARLEGLAAVLLAALEPLGALGAQVLWIAQPTLGLVAPRDEIAALARLLEQPGGVAYLRQRLVGPVSGSEIGETINDER